MPSGPPTRPGSPEELTKFFERHKKEGVFWAPYALLPPDSDHDRVIEINVAEPNTIIVRYDGGERVLRHDETSRVPFISFGTKQRTRAIEDTIYVANGGNMSAGIMLVSVAARRFNRNLR